MKVIIFCGGLGTRLGNETIKNPKPMIKILGIPILVRIMSIFQNYGFNNFILATGYKSKIIEKYYKNKKNIKCIFTGKDTMTGGRLLRLKKYFNKNENFLMTYGDGLSNQNINNLLKFHIKHKKIATLTSVKPPARFGEVFIKGSRVTKFDQ